MKIIVVSKDRPLQVAACLASLEFTCYDLGPDMVEVLYLATSKDMAIRYEVLRSEFPRVRFVPEVGFQETFLDLCHDTSHLCFVVDDTLFVRLWSIADAICLLNDTTPALGVSLRLGKNCIRSYVKGDVAQTVPEMAVSKLRPGWCTYHWPSADKDFNYPLELASSIYRAADVLPILSRGGYKNPNELELVLSAQSQSFVGTKPLLICHGTSIAFANQLNVVQDVCPSRAQGGAGYAVDVLGRLFDAGFRVNLKSVLGFTPPSCQAELPFNMK